MELFRDLRKTKQSVRTVYTWFQCGFLHQRNAGSIMATFCRTHSSYLITVGSEIKKHNVLIAITTLSKRGRRGFYNDNKKSYTAENSLRKFSKVFLEHSHSLYTFCLFAKHIRANLIKSLCYVDSKQVGRYLYSRFI